MATHKLLTRSSAPESTLSDMEEGLQEMGNEKAINGEETASLLNKEPTPPPMKKKKKLILGGVCVLALVITWVAQAQIIGALGSSTEVKWNKPYSLSFGIHCIWMLALPPAMGLHWWQRQSLPRLPWKRLAFYGLTMSIPITGGGYCWYVSLAITTLSVNTAVYNSLFLLVFVMSIIFLKEKLTVFKLNGALQALGGLVLIGIGALWTAADASRNEPIGYVYLIISMASFALLPVVFVKVFPPAISKPFERTPILGLMGVGAIGVANLLVCWLGIVILHYANVETFELPYGSGLVSMILSGLMDVVLNNALLIGSLLVSPTFMSVGALLTIPVGVVLQLIIQGTSINWVQGIGLSLILSGCLTFEVGGKLYKMVTGRV